MESVVHLMPRSSVHSKPRDKELAWFSQKQLPVCGVLSTCLSLMIHGLGSEIKEGVPPRPFPATGSCSVQAEFCKSLFYFLVTLGGGKVC